MLFSIIIPIYNTSIDIFHRCMDSICRQKYTDYEIILIDDGSTEDYSHALQQYELMHVKYQKTVRQGVSKARNRGIELAEGKYIIFIDSDDVICDTFFEQAAHYIQDYSPDVIYGSVIYSRVDAKGIYRLTLSRCKQEDYPGVKDSLMQNSTGRYFVHEVSEIEELKKTMYFESTSEYPFWILGSPCANVYKRELVARICFPENISIMEDQVFNKLIANEMTSCLVVPDEWYYYIQEETSSIHNDFILPNVDSWLEWLKLMLCIADQYSGELKEIASRYLLQVFIGNICNEYIIVFRPKEWGKITSKIQNAAIFQELLKRGISCGKDATIKLWLLSHRMYWLLRMYIIIKKIGRHKK